MVGGYFGELLSEAGTEIWTNNPSGAEMRLAVESGAVGVATNPVYTQALMRSEPDYVRSVADSLVRRSGFCADEAGAGAFMRELVSRPLDLLRPLYHDSRGQYGYCAVQGNPRRNNDLGAIIHEAEELHALGENVIVKLPATPVGVQAMEELTARGWPTIGTMSFSVSQYIAMAQAHRRGLKRTTLRPRCLITMLPGLFDEYLVQSAAASGIEISRDKIRHAGVTTARAAYTVFRERGYEAQVLSGGARSQLHLTEVVGPGMAITLGGALAESALRERPPIVNRIEESAPSEILSELSDKFPDFRRACDPAGLNPAEFEGFGPVAAFQNSFLAGFDLVIQQLAAAKERAELVRHTENSS